VAEQERELVADSAFAIMQVGMADAARLDVHQRLSRTWIRDQHSLHCHGIALGAGYDATYFMNHVGDLMS